MKGEKIGGDRVLVKGVDADCDGGRENGDKGINLRDILRKNLGDLIIDWMWGFEGMEELNMFEDF